MASKKGLVSLGGFRRKFYGYDLRDGLNYTSCLSGAVIFSDGNRVADLIARTAISDVDSSQVSVGEGGCGAGGVARQRDGDT